MNMNKMNTNIIINTVPRTIPNHTLDNVENPSEDLLASL
jgi:hypothetical protein